MTTEHTGNNDPRIIKAVEEYTAKQGHAPALFFSLRDVSDFLKANEWVSYSKSNESIYIMVAYHNERHYVSIVGNFLDVTRTDVRFPASNSFYLDDIELTSFKGIISVLAVMRGFEKDTD